MASDTQDSLLSAATCAAEGELPSGASTPLRSSGPSPAQSAEDVSKEEEEASFGEINGVEGGSIDEQSVESLDTGQWGKITMNIEF